MEKELLLKQAHEILEKNPVSYLFLTMNQANENLFIQPFIYSSSESKF